MQKAISILVAIYLIGATSLLISLIGFGQPDFLIADSNNGGASTEFGDSISNEDLLSVLSNKMILPNEDPTIGTIDDVEVLKTASPEFYAQAENGDKLVVYTTKAIVYRPSSDLIVNVVNVNTPGLADQVK